MKNKVTEYCVNYSCGTQYETAWFKAKSAKKAVEQVKDVMGGDVIIYNVIGRPKHAQLGRHR